MTHVLKAGKQKSGFKFDMSINLEKEFKCCDWVEQYNCKCADANNLPSMDSASEKTSLKQGHDSN